MKPMGFKIRTEHHAQRCELCHQKDQFDPETGFCFRCAPVQPGKSQHVVTLHQVSDFFQDPITIYEAQIIQTYQSKIGTKRLLLALLFWPQIIFPVFIALFQSMECVLIELVFTLAVIVAYCLFNLVADNCPNCDASMPGGFWPTKHTEQLHCPQCGVRLS